MTWGQVQESQQSRYRTRSRGNMSVFPRSESLCISLFVGDIQGRSRKQVVTYNENPSPTREIVSAVHLHETICKNTTESRSHTANEIKYCVTFLKFITWIPCAQEVNAARVESSFKAAKNHPENS